MIAASWGTWLASPGAPAWAVWLAVGLSVLGVLTWVVVVVVARRAWRQLRPLLEPYLVAFGFGPGDTGAASAGGGSIPADAPDRSAPPDPLDVQRAPWKQ